MSSDILDKISQGKIPIKKKKISVKEYLEKNLDWEAHENFKEDVE